MLCFEFSVFEIGSPHCVALTSFELVTLLSQPLRYWDYRCVPLCLLLCKSKCLRFITEYGWDGMVLTLFSWKEKQRLLFAQFFS